MDRKPGYCMICQTDQEQVRNIDLYIIGSEGLNCCLTCELDIVAFVRLLKNNVTKYHLAELKKRIKK